MPSGAAATTERDQPGEGGYGREHPPTILFIAERMVLGGAERHFIQKATYMKSFGCRVVVASSGGPLEDELYRRGIPHVRIRSDVGRPVATTDVHADLRVLAGVVRREGIDVVNCMAGMPFALASCLWEFTHIPVAYEVLSPYYCLAADWAPALRRHIEQCGGFYANGPAEAANQCRVCGLPAEAARIFPLSVDTGVFRPLQGSEMRARYGFAPDDAVVMTASRLAPEKHASISALIEACRDLGRSRPHLQLVVVGDGPSRAQIEAEARSAGVRSLFTGQGTDMAAIYSMADMFVGMGMTAQEAAACGKPVVLTNLSQGSDRLSVGYWGDDEGTELGNGTPYPGCNLRPIEDLLAPLLDAPALRAKLGARGREAVMSRFSADRVNLRWFEEFCRLAATRDSRLPNPAR